MGTGAMAADEEENCREREESLELAVLKAATDVARERVAKFFMERRERVPGV